MKNTNDNKKKLPLLTEVVRRPADPSARIRESCGWRPAESGSVGYDPYNHSPAVTATEREH